MLGLRRSEEHYSPPPDGQGATVPSISILPPRMLRIGLGSGGDVCI